jgi:16S rRNA (adenine1518-N6/adenine1519-N6)-dimethyltransferase
MNSQQHKHRKRFGQHFLSDESILQEMQRCIHPCSNDHMIEVGPGLGVLTRYLVDHVAQFEAIEIDRDLVALLGEAFGHHDNFTLHQQDVLRTDWAALAKEKKLRVVGNLPYNISTPLIFSLYNVIAKIEDMHFLLQREVGLRMAAGVGTSNYGRLSVMTQYFCDVELLFDVDPHAFTPPPKVNSTFLRLVPKNLETQQAVDIKALESVVATAFNQRRKTLRNSLRKVLDETAFSRLDIDPQKRAQDLGVAEYIKIANFL